MLRGRSCSLPMMLPRSPHSAPLTVALRVLLFSLLAPLPSLVAGQALNDHDNAPLSGIFGLQNSIEGGTLAGKNLHSWNFASIISSHSVVKPGPDEQLKFDGETTRLNLMYRYGVTDRLEFGIEIPYLFHESGNLDSIVVGWHDFFGLPNGVRNTLANDQIDFQYSDQSGEQVELSSSSNGIGDMRLLGGLHLFGSGTSNTALRFGVKFPTGDSSQLHGSGGIDISIGIAGDFASLWGVERLNGFYRLSGTYIGEPEFLQNRYRKFIGTVSGGLGYYLTAVMELRAQTTLRTPLYDSEINALGDSSAMLSFGANFRLSDRYTLALGVGEDINVSTAPDVTFIITLDYQGG